MNQMMKFAPWLLSAVLAIFLIFNWQQSHVALEQKDAELQNTKQQLAQKDVELQNAKQQNTQLVSEANAKVEEADARYKQLADDANKKIAAASQREVQVRVSFRKAILSSGNVARLANLEGQSIAITIDVERPASGQKKSFSTTIDPRQFKEIGEQQGWAFVRGDTVKVNQPDHKSLIFTAP